MKKLCLILLLLAAPALRAQFLIPDCVVPFSFSAIGASVPFNNRTTGCAYWGVVYNSQGFAGLSMQFESASDSGGTPAAFVLFQGTLLSGANPASAATQQVSTFSGFYAWLRINLTSVTGTGNITGVAYGYRQPIAVIPIQGISGGTAVPVMQATASNFNGTVVGPVASGSPVSGNPVRMSGNDNTNVQDVRTVSAANLSQSQNTGAVLTEKGSRWTVVGSPALSAQATASKAAGGAGVRHVVDCIGFSASSVTAPALTALTINLRDGASGAGSVIRSYSVAISATTGQNLSPQEFCGLNLVGTAATAMTFEFSAGLTNLQQVVNISGYDVQ